MNFQEFRKGFFDQKVFSTNDIAKEWADFNYVNLINWQDKGYLIKLRNTWYAFPDALKTEADLYFIANRLQKPSYISLKTALRYYNWIPESVFSITSITTAKPAEWQTPIGHFSYRSIKPHLFFGYQPVKEQQQIFNIADPEKTLLDLLYFNSYLSDIPDFEGLRLNREEITSRLDVAKMTNYLAHIDSPALEKRWQALKNFLNYADA
jgi:predicted transcriptional regulator of viral defense system